jgi:hypothetical protein
MGEEQANLCNVHPTSIRIQEPCPFATTTARADIMGSDACVGVRAAIERPKELALSFSLAAHLVNNSVRIL